MPNANMCRSLILAFVVLPLFSLPLLAQPPVELQQAFLDLSHDGVVMNISAHPDDEDGATLAYYRMKFGAKTYSLFFTRGEGGQNETGPELYEELGVLRTRETEAAAALQGTEARFLNLMDFGYSKTATEAFQKWGGRTEVLRRLVSMVRRLKPDVIITNHNTIDGHGHHQAAAIATIEAFDAAADSTFFPEQLKEPGLSLWQPRKLFFRNFGRVDQRADVVNPIGDINAARGMSYLDIAAEALKRHKSQGMDKADLRRFTRGLSLYKLMRANSLYEQDSTTFFGGIDVWRDHTVAPLSGLKTRITSMHQGMAQDSLLEAASKTLEEIEGFRFSVMSPLARRMLAHWQEDIEEIVRSACGIVLSFRLDDSVVVAKQKVGATLSLTWEDCAISTVQHTFEVPQGWAVNEAEGHAPERKRGSYTRDFTVLIGETPTLTLPRGAAQYAAPGSGNDIVARVRFLVNGHRVSVATRPSFDVAPPRVLTVTPLVSRMSAAQHSGGKKFEVLVKNYFPHKTAGRITVQVPEGWRGEGAAFDISREDSSATCTIVVTPPRELKGGEYRLRFRSDEGTKDAVVRVFDVSVARNAYVGIIKSYDTTLEEALGELGVQYHLLGEKDLAEGSLSRYTTIVVDIRAYAVREDLKRFNQRLLAYARNGGHLVVMYQKDQDWTPEYAPYPMQLTRKRVCTEEAPVEMLQPNHPLLSFPNTIGDADWDGWVQERAVYLPAKIAPEYVQLLSSHDPDEPEVTTGYICAPVGSGSYVYTSYVWYRQLKEFNPGAYRCFANMISYPKVGR